MASLPASQNRTSPFSLPALLLVLLLLHAAAIALFTRGFLLTRVELSVRSTPADRTAWRSGTGGISRNTDGGEGRENGKTEDPGGGNGKRECGIDGRDGDWSCQGSEERGEDVGLKALYDKVVIVVIDAARFDFVANTTSYNQGRPGSWIGRLKAVGEIVKAMGHGAALFRFTADPPTTSLQRIKGLTTGGLPTFIDVGSSFGSYTITEDNLLFQLLSVGKRLEMMGDDTWLDVFPSAFNQSTPFPSLVVKDIHTVDDGVLANIFPALNRDDWDLLIGHFLGVDHVGHTFAVDSPIMDAKLDQMNRMMLDVVTAMKAQAHRGGRHERSLLLFMSDHGQTLTGDHGGGTPEEAHAFLLAVSMQPAPHPLPAFLSSCSSHRAAGAAAQQKGGNEQEECFEEFPQIDFTPTLSVLLGAPIPFASVGKVNPHMLALSPAAWASFEPPLQHSENAGPAVPTTPADPNEDPAVPFLSRLSSALMMNAWQVHRYLSRYSNEAPSPFPHQPFSHLEQLYTHALSTANSLPSSLLPSPSTSSLSSLSSSLVSSIQAHITYLDAAAALARSQWTQFGISSMLSALLLLLLSLLLHLLLILRYTAPRATGFGSAAAAGVRVGGEEGSGDGIGKVKAVASEQGGGRGKEVKGKTEEEDKEKETEKSRKGGRKGKKLESGAQLSSAPLLTDSDDRSTPSTISQGCGTRGGACVEDTAAVGGAGTGASDQGCLWMVVWAVVMVLMHSLSLNSNSFIMEEGHVAAFLLATSALLHLRQSLVAGSWSGILQSSSLLLINTLLISLGLSASHKLSNQAAATADATAATAAAAAAAAPSTAPAAAAASSSTVAASSAAAAAGAAVSGALSPSQFLSSLPSLLLSYAPLVLVPLLLQTLSSSLLSSLRRSPPLTQASATKGSKSQPALEKLGQVFFSLAARVPQLGMWVGYALLALLWLLHDSPSFLPFVSDHSSDQQQQQQQQQHEDQQQMENPKQPKAGPPAMFPVSSLQEAVHLGLPRLVFASSLLFFTLSLLLMAAGSLCCSLSRILLVPASAAAAAASVAGGSKQEGREQRGKKMKGGAGGSVNGVAGSEPRQQQDGQILSPPQLQQQQQSEREQKLGRMLIHLIGLFGVPIVLVGGRSIPVILLLSILQGVLFLSLSRSHSSVPSFVLCCVEWSLLSILLFFASGHACTFDGLRYTAAFVGFNDFQYHRQGGLLALDTFGFSHLIPAFAIPLLALLAHPRSSDSLTKRSIKAILLFLFPRAMATFTTTAFVAGMRRHLMVWSLFAPKYVFDAIGLLVLDVFLLFVSLVVIAFV
ncbi:hypothetical protein CLOM_g4864 [Closterium sp. NIES-68]|nr:hypothetical protein CLOM_g4864 [Closterium sp. NIES-68]GJP70588.1 hypothetical protein CLOP_g1511 [Closterium sp. NIES-67]